MFIDFRERARKREASVFERNINWLLPVHTLAKDKPET